MADIDVQEVYGIVQDKFNFAYALKERQIEVIRRVMAKKNVLGVLSTGFGKSACFLLPPLLWDEIGDPHIRHIAVVISPLKSLMRDQVQKCDEHGISGVQVMGKKGMDSTVLQEVKDGHYSIVFMSPEIMVTPLWRDIMRSKVYRTRCVLVCLDEAHCIVDWGRDDFRVAYKEVHRVQSWLDRAAFLLLTATMTPQLKVSTLEAVGIDQEDLEVVAMLPDRPNIFIDVRVKPGLKLEVELQWLAKELEEKKDECRKTLVYSKTINMVSNIGSYLTLEAKEGAYVSKERTSRNRRVGVYHAEVPDDYQRYYLEEFLKPNSTVRVLVATVAFGMGVNIPDVDLVVHWGVPKGILSYWQEMGRCCRDGRDGQAIFYDVRATKSYNPKSDKEMIQFCTKLEKEEECVRSLILSSLLLPEMDQDELKAIKTKESCASDHCEACTCPMCRCCSVCRKRCPCFEQ